MPKSSDSQPDAGASLAEMRTARRLSQVRLAELASVGRATIQNAEASPDWRLTSSTTRAIVGALQSCQPLTQAERDTLKKIMNPAVFSSIDSADAIAERFADASGAELDRAVGRFRHLVDALGAERVADALEAIARLTGRDADRAPETPETQRRTATERP